MAREALSKTRKASKPRVAPLAAASLPLDPDFSAIIESLQCYVYGLSKLRIRMAYVCNPFANPRFTAMSAIRFHILPVQEIL